MKYLLLIFLWLIVGCTSPKEHPQFIIGTNVSFAPNSDYSGCQGVARESEEVNFFGKKTSRVKVRLKTCGQIELSKDKEIIEEESKVVKGITTNSWVGQKVFVNEGTYKGCQGMTVLAGRQPASQFLSNERREENHRFVKDLQCQGEKVLEIVQIPEKYLTRLK